MSVNDLVISGVVFLLGVVAAWLWFGAAGRNSGDATADTRGPGAVDVIISVVIALVVITSGATMVWRSMVAEPRSGARMQAIEDLGELREIEKSLDTYQRAVDSQREDRIAPLLCSADADWPDLANDPPFLRGVLRSPAAGQYFVVDAADRLGAGVRVHVQQVNQPTMDDRGVMYLVEAAPSGAAGTQWLICPSIATQFGEGT